MEQLFKNVSTNVIKQLNENPDSSYTIQQNKIEEIFERDFRGFSQFREPIFDSCQALLTEIIKDIL